MRDEPGDEQSEVVQLNRHAPRQPSQSVRRPGRLHGWAIAGMGLSSIVGIVATLAFITVRWPEDTGRFVVGTIVVAVVCFLLCATIAVFAAARDTYAYPRRKTEEKPGADT